MNTTNKVVVAILVSILFPFVGLTQDQIYISDKPDKNLKAEKVVFLTDILLQSVKGEKVVINNSEISLSNLEYITTNSAGSFKAIKSLNQFLIDKGAKEANGLIELRGPIRFNNCKFPDNLTLRNFNIDNLRVHNSILGNFDISNCKLKDAIFFGCSGDYFQIERSEVSGRIEISGDITDATIRNVDFTKQFKPCEFEISIDSSKIKLHQLERVFSLSLSNANGISFIKNRLINGSPDLVFIITGKVNEIGIEDNSINTSLDLDGLIVVDRFKMVNNKNLQYVVMQNTVLPQSFCLIDWPNLEGHKLATRITYFIQKEPTETPCGTTYYIEDRVDKFFSGKENDFEDQFQVKELIRVYRSIYDIYSKNGDLEFANGCFVEMKDIESENLKFKYNQNPTFKKYFRWKLSKILKIYTNHSTDPALALVISIYIIISFGFIYFFFPSDWDITSKTRMLRDFKEFIEKNEKGYILPFFKMILGIGLSFINAFTLSLNAFVTLGFGNIPTKGAARYICVLEGFIGWFLLSIFTVALINQVLF